MTDPLATNTIVQDRFELVQRLDDHGYGESFRAQDRRLRSRFVTLKFLRRVSEPELPESMVDHAQLLRQFKHPGVLATVGHGLHAGRPFLVHEFFEGKSLGAGLDEARVTGELLPVKLLELIFARIAAAVSAGHARPQPVVHGCINPGCVILQQVPGRELEVKLFDFGVTRFADPDPASPARSARALLFLAPEQIQSPDSPPTAAMDVFGLGALLREMLSVPPDPGATLTPTTVLRRRDDCPMDLWRAAGVAMSASPAERHATVDAFLDVVQRCWAAAPVTLPRPESPSRPHAQPPPLTADAPRAASPEFSAPAWTPAEPAELTPRYELPALPSPRPVADYAATLAISESAGEAHPWSAAVIPASMVGAAQPMVSSMDDLMRAVQAGPRGAAAAASGRHALDRTSLLDEGSDFSRRQREALVTTEAGTLVLEEDTDFSATSIDPLAAPSSARFAKVSAVPRDPDLAGTMILNDPPPARSDTARPVTVFPPPQPPPPPSQDLGGTLVLEGMGGGPKLASPLLGEPYSAGLPLGPLPNAPAVMPPLHVLPPSARTLSRPVPPPPEVTGDDRFQVKVAALAIAVFGGLGLALVLVKMLFEASR